MSKMRFWGLISTVFIILIFGAKSVFPQSNEFSYQGFLTDNSASANGNFDFEFRLYSAASGGSALGTIQRTGVPVTNGVFGVSLDFGAEVFSGPDRFLEISVKPAGGGSFTTLAPRQKIGRAPYAVTSKFAEQAGVAVNATNAQTAVTATNSLQLGGIAANQYVLTNDGRLTDARNPLPNSANYIQNRTTVQTAANFNINGDGTLGGTLLADVVTARTSFNFDSNGRILGRAGVNNLFVGVLAGSQNGGQRNTLVGDSAGRDNTGDENSYFGFLVAQTGTTGSFNTFIGSRSGLANTTGNENTFLGYNADAGSGTLTNATAIGANAFVEQSNTLVLGSISGVNGATAMTDVGIGTTTPARRLDVNGIIRVGSTTGTIGCIEDRDGTVIAGTCASDARFKKDISPVGSVLKNFAKLRPVNFYWRTEEFESKKFGTRQSYGLIAQEVEAAFPELVSTDEQGYKMVNYAKLPLYTIQAVNELKAENDALKNELSEQKTRLEKQRAEIDELKKAVEMIQTRTAQTSRKAIRPKTRAGKSNRR